MAAIEFRGLTKCFGDTAVIRGVDLAVPAGAFLSLVGPSGCGKTTLLRMLAGLEMPDAGEILIDGAIVNALPPAARDIAMVFQSYALYPQMSVAQNIGYPLRKRGVPRAERDARVAQVAAMLRLDALLDRKPKQLSGGQQQRVALGRALVREPRAFLLDEPLSNLDAALRTHMRGEIVDLHRRLGRTTVYVTHDQLEAMTMSTHVAVLDGGVVQQFGAPADLYDRPANRMVAGFIGTPAMAFLDGSVDADGTLHVAGEAVATGLPAAPGDIVVGIRAEDVRPTDQGIATTVERVENAGHETLVALRCAAGAITARLPGSARLAAGDILRVTLPADRLHLFDSAGSRIAVRPQPIGASGAGHRGRITVHG